MAKVRQNLLKKLLAAVGILLAVLLVIVLVYVLYVMITYKRIPDKQALEIRTIGTPQKAEALPVREDAVYSVMTYNIGFGAYTTDFSFFMDGGKYSRAFSKEAVIENVEGSASAVATLEPDFMLFQEVDLDSTRSYHVNQSDLIDAYFTGFYTDFAVNYDSAYLMVPLTKPHGSSYSGMASYSRYPISSALRRSLPVSSSLSKFTDLDRCYSVTRIPTENGKELCLYNVHLSAYCSDAEVRNGQVAMLCEDMAAEYAKGNYVVCGGDFNHDWKADWENQTDEYASWAYPFPRNELPEGFVFGLDLLSEEAIQNMANTGRETGTNYFFDTTPTYTLDGFIFSDNVQMVDYRTIDFDYTYSDHNPVYMEFRLLD